MTRYQPDNPSIQPPYGIRPTNPVPVDWYSGPFTGSNIAEAVSRANQSIFPGERFRSLEVRLLVGSDTYKYWYYGGTANSDLVPFSSDSSVLASGPEGAIQFNDGGSFSGSSSLVYVDTSKLLVLGSNVALQFGDGTTQGTARNFYGITGPTTQRFPLGMSGSGNTGDRLLVATGPSSDPFRNYVRFGNAWFQTGVVGIGQGPQGERGETGSFTGDFVRTLNGLTGDISITAGQNVSVGLSGNTITISASGGSAETTWGRTDAVTTTVGGVASGSTFDVATNAIAVLHKMLYPYQNASFTFLSMGLPISSIVDLGTTSAAGSYSATWGHTQTSNWKPNTLSISRLSPSPTTLISGLSIGQSGVSVAHPAYRYTTPTNLSFNITGEQQQGSNPSLSVFPYNWRARIYNGKSTQASLNASYSSFATFSSLFTNGISQQFTPGNTTLVTGDPAGTQITFPATTNAEYMWLFSPSILPTFGQYNYFVEQSSPGFQQAPSLTGNITITNANGVSMSYIYYRWEFPTSGATDFRIKVT